MPLSWSINSSHSMSPSILMTMLCSPCSCRINSLRLKGASSRNSKKTVSFRSHVQVRTLTDQYHFLILIAQIIDIVERFSLALMLCMVAFRNLIELSGSEFDFSGGFGLPKSFGWFRGNNVLWTISYVGFSPTNSSECFTMFAPASIDSHDLRDACRLAETCLYHQVQSHPPISIRTLYRRSLS